MAYRKYVIILLLLLPAIALKAQQDPCARADSISYKLYTAAEWQKLITFADSSLNMGIDFQLLRYRLAYARFITADYKGALAQYNQILAKDSYDPTAHYYAYYCNSYLNNQPGSAVNAAFIDSITLKKEGINKYGFTGAALEAGIKSPQGNGRRTGYYSRIGVGERIGWRLSLDQSVMYFNQQVYVPNSTNTTGPINTAATQTYNDDSQIEYYLKSRYAISNNTTLLGAYHYLNTTFGSNSFGSNLGLLGISYTGGTYTDLQADVNLGEIYGAHIIQYNAQLTWYPKGNLNLYTISRASLKNYNAVNELIYSQSFGFKASRKIWLETNITLGNLENYLDADGLYLYNAIDNTKFKGGATLFYPLNLHALLQINYTYETKFDIYRLANYSQHSLTAGIAWKF